jgi:hypothetical protein
MLPMKFGPLLQNKVSKVKPDFATVTEFIKTVGFKRHNH